MARIFVFIAFLWSILNVAYAAPSNQPGYQSANMGRMAAAKRPPLTVGARQATLKEVLNHVYSEAHAGRNTAVFILNSKMHDYVLYTDIAQELRNRGMHVTWSNQPGFYKGQHYDYSFTVTDIM